MRKLASPNDLRDQLHILSRQAVHGVSRLHMAARLHHLANRVAATTGLSKALKHLDEAEEALANTPEGKDILDDLRALKKKLQAQVLFKKGDKILYGGAIEGVITKNQKPGSPTVEADTGYGKMLIRVNELSRL